MTSNYARPALCQSSLKTHLLLAVSGYVSLLVVGVSYKLVSMFTLAEDLLPWRLAWTELVLVATR